MFGNFPEDLLAQFKQDYAERRQAMAIGYPQQSYSDKESMPCNKPKSETHNGKSAGDFKAAAKTAKQDFSEGVFDFGFCKRPDGTRYGIADNSKCQPPNKPAAAPKKKVYSAEDTEYMYKKYMTMAKNEGQGSLEAGSSARRMLEAAGMDPTAMDGMARRNVRIEVFGK